MFISITEKQQILIYNPTVDSSEATPGTKLFAALIVAMRCNGSHYLNQREKLRLGCRRWV